MTGAGYFAQRLLKFLQKIIYCIDFLYIFALQIILNVKYYATNNNVNKSRQQPQTTF